MKESVIQKKILDTIRVKGGYAIKVISANRNGVPDILACYKGRFFGIEVKGPRGKASAIQLTNLTEIVAAGGKAFIAQSVSEVLTKLEEIDNE